MEPKLEGLKEANYFHGITAGMLDQPVQEKRPPLFTLSHPGRSHRSTGDLYNLGGLAPFY